jgi:hypothetical protein
MCVISEYNSTEPKWLPLKKGDILYINGVLTTEKWCGELNFSSDTIYTAQ